MTEPEQPQRRRVLLDENLHRKFVLELPECDATTVEAVGWKGVLNSELLRKIEEAGYDVFLTGDRNLEYQQRIPGRTFGVVVIISPRLTLTYLQALAPMIRTAVADVSPGEVIHVSRS
ncbi:MAG: hypothetical protein ACJ8J0_02140 [Longimicrobiaceae bacterium]